MPDLDLINQGEQGCGTGEDGSHRRSAGNLPDQDRMAHVVVLPAGFAGLWSAAGAVRALDEFCSRDAAGVVTLVNRDAWCGGGDQCADLAGHDPCMASHYDPEGPIARRADSFKNSGETATEQRASPLFFCSPYRCRPRISAANAISMADNLPQQQQKQQRVPGS
jgi:hypothetical protein